MSDLSMYEFEDIAWDEFCQSNNHIVPHPSGEKISEYSLLCDSHKKPSREVVGVSDKVEDRSANKNFCWEGEEDKFSVVNNKRKTMLETDSWLQTPDGVFPSCDSDSVKEDSSLASDGVRTSTYCYKSNNIDAIESEFCATDAIVDDKSAAVDSNSYDYPFGHISQTDDLNCFYSSCDDKDSGDFLYYGWPDIGNFEDVDRIFRSCEFGANNDDQLGWFSSPDAVEGSGDVLKSEFKFSCPDSTAMQNKLENCEHSRINDTCGSMNDSSMKNTSVGCKNGSWPLVQEKHDTLGHLSFVKQTSSSNRTGDFMPVQQGAEYDSEVQNKIQASNHSTNGSSGMMNMCGKQPRQQSQSDGDRSDQYLSNGTSFYYSNDCLQNEDSTLPSEATSHKAVSSIGVQQQKQATGHKPFSYLQSDIQYINTDYLHPLGQTTVYPALSAIKSENSGFTAVSPKESYSSNQVLSADSSHGPSFQVPNEKRRGIHHQQVFLSPYGSKPENMDMGVQVPLCDSVSMEKNAQLLGNKFEARSDTGGVPGELGSSTLEESSSVCSVLDGISLEAASFRKLQLVMEQLDVSTKLCIRDSLYRLARSAEQRHNHGNLNGSCCRDDRDSCGVVVSEGANKYTGFMDMETGTNRVDRSMAHLLFEWTKIDPQTHMPIGFGRNEIC